MKRKILFPYIILTTIFVLPINLFAEQVTVVVKGMVCSFCAQGIHKRLGKDSNISNVKVDLDKKEVKFDLADGKHTSDLQVKEAIEDAGYEVDTISRTQK